MSILVTLFIKDPLVIYIVGKPWISVAHSMCNKLTSLVDAIAISNLKLSITHSLTHSLTGEGARRCDPISKLNF